MSADAGNVVQKQRQKADRVWQNRAAWDSLYWECYEYAIPNRRPGGPGKSKRTSQLIFDMTAPSSVMHGAGQLVRQLFGPTLFQLAPGPLLKNRLDGDDYDSFARHLSDMQSQIYPFFTAGDFDSAIHETAIDLFVGTGAIMPLKGPSIEEPILFVNIPFEEIATACDAWGRQHFITWKTTLTAEEVFSAFPNGKFPNGFADKVKSKPNEECTLYQDFYRLADRRWKFIAYLPDSMEFITSNISQARPIAVPRFYKAPGEPYGRGPLLLAMPTIKTVNKAQELALKSAAIQMLGLWGFRAGGTFQPDQVDLAPGAFWPMQSTGGVMGPDITRLDPATGRLDVARMIISGSQEQIRDALFDTRLFNQGATPPSAMEVSARVAQNAKIHIGAYGRLINEIMPVLVPRAIEILSEWQLVNMPLPLNPLLYSVKVVSPMAAALQADRLSGAMNFVQLVASIAGPQNVGNYVNIDRLMALAQDACLVDVNITPTPQEKQQFQQQQAAAQTAETLNAMGERAAPQIAQAALAEESAGNEGGVENG